MTKNQIDALRNLETERHNKEQEKLERAVIPAQYISSIGSLLRGSSGFFSRGGGSSSKTASTNYGTRGTGKVPSSYVPIKWTIH